MGTRYLTDLADVLRRAGLTVVEVGPNTPAGWTVGDEWRTRSRSSGGFDGDRPWGICWHHTASNPGTSAAANVQYGTFNSPDEPIMNLYLHADGVWYVCAAGATNTEGKGGPLATSHGTIPADQGNTHTLSVEAGNDGVGEVWPVEQIDAYFAGTIALLDAYQLEPGDVFLHATWAPTRKIDPARADAVAGVWQPRSINTSGTWNVDDVRDEIRRRRAVPPTPTPTPPTGDVMAWTEVQIAEAGAVFMGWESAGWIPQVEWINGDDPAQLARYSAYQAGGMPKITLSYIDLENVTLLGPVPTRDDRFADNGLRWSADLFANVIGG
jgi:hypothetical protein